MFAFQDFSFVKQVQRRKYQQMVQKWFILYLHITYLMIIIDM